MRRVAHPKPAPQREQRREPGRQRLGGQEREPVGFELRLGLGETHAGQDAEFAQDVDARDPTLSVQDAVDENGNTESREEQRHQRQQIGGVARPVVGWDDDGSNRALEAQPTGALVDGTLEAQDLGRGLPFHSQRHEDRAELELRHAAIEQRGEKMIGLVRREIACSLLPATDLLDVKRVGHDDSEGGERKQEGRPASPGRAKCIRVSQQRPCHHLLHILFNWLPPDPRSSP